MIGTPFAVFQTFPSQKYRRHVSLTSASGAAIPSGGRECSGTCTPCRRCGSATSCQPITIPALLRHQREYINCLPLNSCSRHQPLVTPHHLHSQQHRQTSAALPRLSKRGFVYNGGATEEEHIMAGSLKLALLCPLEGALSTEQWSAG